MPDESLAGLCYPFRCNHPIKGCAPDEHWLQVRYGGAKSWPGSQHRLGQDLAAVDVTVVLGVHIEADILIGLDPLLYDPLPRCSPNESPKRSPRACDPQVALRPNSPYEPTPQRLRRRLQRHATGGDASSTGPTLGGRLSGGRTRDGRTSG